MVLINFLPFNFIFYAKIIYNWAHTVQYLAIISGSNKNASVKI